MVRPHAYRTVPFAIPSTRRDRDIGGGGGVVVVPCFYSCLIFASTVLLFFSSFCSCCYWCGCCCHRWLGKLHAYGTVPLAYPSTRRDHDAFTQLRWKTGGAYSRSCCRTYAIAFHPPSSNSLRTTIPRYIRQYTNIVVTTPLTTGRVVCVMISYGHFFIEHNRGHHKLVKAPCLPPFFVSCLLRMDNTPAVFRTVAITVSPCYACS